MGIPNLQIFREDTPTVEVGTELSPIDFGICMAGEIVPLPYDLLLYNDKDGSEDAPDARYVSLELLRLEVLAGWTSTGVAYQTDTITTVPIKAADVRVDGALWTRVYNLSSYGPTLYVYTFDFTSGVIMFGDNIHGAIPENGKSIVITVQPDLNTYGKAIVVDSWVSYKSYGTVAPILSIDSEVGDLIDSTHVQVTHFPEVVDVVGVWDNIGKTGTNYFTGGTVDSLTGIITLGTTLVGTPYVEYSYKLKDDAEGTFTPFVAGYKHSLAFPLPKQSAKCISLQANIPIEANTEGGVNLRVILRVYYWY
jgi:hypothetical protein